MTISSTNRKAGPFIGNGSASVFAFSFRVFAASDLEVVQITVATGVETTLTINSAYTVSLNADQNSNPGGSITLTGGALASGYNLIITSDIANLQPTDLTNQGGFYPEVITGALDRATIQIQQLDEHVNRTLAYPITDPSLGVELPAVAQRKGTVLAFNATTGAPEAGPSIGATNTVSANTADINTVAANIADVNIVAGNIGAVTGAKAMAQIYQGAKASDPALRNSGDALETGDLYFNTSNNRMRVYETGTGWIDYEATAQTAATTATTQAGIATSAAATATTQASTATTQATVATNAKIAAETARDAAYVNADVYASTAAGLAATTSGQQFQVISGNEAIRYTNSAGTAVELGRYPLSSIVNEASEYGTVRERMLEQQRIALLEKPKAAVVILLGQSLNAPWDTVVRTRAAPGAKMLTGGSSMRLWQYNAVNQEWVGVWGDLASVVDYEERTAQTPGVGIINTLAGGTYSRIYLGNAALGGQPLPNLMGSGMITNLWAMLQRLCEIARADGYNPEVMFYTAHGEANAFLGTSEATYYELGQEYYGRCQLYAAQAMRRPGYQAPIAFTYPLENFYGSGDYDRTIKTAISRLIADLPNTIDVGAIYQWPATADRVHPTPASFVLRGEAVGRALRAFADDRKRAMAPRIIDVTLNGAEFVATFNKQVTRDNTMTAGTNLNVSLQRDGFEWLDNGTGIAISALVYEGRRVRGTLASTPAGTLVQQTLRLAVQTTTASSVSGIANVSGCQVRSTELGWIAINDPTFTNYDWAVPQTFTAVRALT